MRKHILVCVFVVFLAVVLVQACAVAGVKFQEGIILELKHEYWKNQFDMDNHALDNRNFFQVKTTPWMQADFNKDFSGYVRLLNQFAAYAYYAPSATKTSGQLDKSYRFDIDETIFDNLYFDARNLLGSTWDLRIGRQDFVGQYGEGFLIFDGTPADGPRSAYFNAAKFTWHMPEKNSLDFIYIFDPRDDTLLPVINENNTPQPLNASNEEGYTLYWKNNRFAKLALEGYYIYKREGKGGFGPQAEKGIINTFGSYLKYNLAPWAFRGQFAYQFGNYGANGRRGIGGYVFADRDFDALFWSPEASIGFISLSGDKQDSSKNESWDPLFSRWGWISDSYPNALASDTGMPAYWTNVQVYRTGVVLEPTAKMKLSFWYNLLRANEKTAPSVILSGSGRNRGHLSQAKIEYTFSKNVCAYFEAEYLIPGNFYNDRDPALFFRTDITLQF